VRASLGNQAADLECSDTRPFYQRLGFTFLTFRRYLEQQHAAGQRVDIVAEPVSETAKDRVAAYLSYEAVWRSFRSLWLPDHMHMGQPAPSNFGDRRRPEPA
jgi:hypothetical protein